MELENLTKRRNELADLLLASRNRDGFWEGRLSSSALGVAVAITALHFDDPVRHKAAMERGVEWLVTNQNRDGGYGDSPESTSNISTSLLVYAAFNRQEDATPRLWPARENLSGYLNSRGIDVNSTSVANTILAHYKTDHTFSVPILVMCALCGIPSIDAFRKIPRLPFELALLPRSFYRILKLSVVSYAIPALIAVGIAIFHHKRNGNPLAVWLRRKAIAPSLRLLQSLMPESGGFLEAIPLTAFVSICLIASGHRDLHVVEKGVGFLQRTQRDDGSWPIDIDLSTWVTTLSIKALQRSALAGHGQADAGVHTGNMQYAGTTDDGLPLNARERDRLTGHILGLQYTTVHPFNGAMPGGWGWTNHAGSVPDGDDTPGAIIALLILNRHQPENVKDAATAGCDWLLNLRNSDGGFPTFVRGWGRLPFDQSCADLTGHGVLALSMTLNSFKNNLIPTQYKNYEKAIRQGIAYLQKNQRPDGALLPLWFGNQQTAGHLNPVYGTARVLTYLNDMTVLPVLSDAIQMRVSEIIKRGRTYLHKAQNPDGSWGGDAGVPGTLEETALALGALAGEENPAPCSRAAGWLDQYYAEKGLVASPIGLYFASLWYDEVLYPHTAYLEGISRLIRMTRQNEII